MVLDGQDDRVLGGDECVFVDCFNDIDEFDLGREGATVIDERLGEWKKGS